MRRMLSGRRTYPNLPEFRPHARAAVLYASRSRIMVRHHGVAHGVEGTSGLEARFAPWLPITLRHRQPAGASRLVGVLQRAAGWLGRHPHGSIRGPRAAR